MLLDWVTVRCPLELLSQEARDAANMLGDRISRFCPKTGDVRYVTTAWDSIRSDSHQMAMRAGVDLWLQGSPARVIGEGDAVFGAGASSALNLVGCVNRMIQFAKAQLNVDLPPADVWIVSRIDITGNFCLATLAEVRHALALLRNCEGGRYRVSQQKGDTVYWSHGSKMRAGKAYAKGPHLIYLMKKPDYTGYQYSQEEIKKAESILRLELKLGREWFARHNWQTLTADDFKKEFDDYFNRMIGGVDMKDDADLQTQIVAAAKTEGQGRAAYGCWMMIQNEGWERAREFYSKTSWYRHLQILRSAGLRDLDISTGNIVPLRRRVLEARLVTSWSQLAA